MGNRAVITEDINGIGIYLHWNGGKDSVNAFLTYCKLRGFRADDYGMARLTQVICNFFGGGLSVGIDLCKNLDTDNGDNGTYIIKNWEIVDRLYFDGEEQTGYNLDEFLQAIDEAQPENERLGSYLTSKPVSIGELKIGDKVVFIDDLHGTPTEGIVSGFGESGKVVNGTDVSGIPYINRYSTDSPESNINNYLHKYDIRLAAKEETEKPEITINEELNGIEIKFNSIPTQETREALKTNGFRWNRKKAVWYAKYTPERLGFAKQTL